MKYEITGVVTLCASCACVQSNNDDSHLYAFEADVVRGRLDALTPRGGYLAHESCSFSNNACECCGKEAEEWNHNYTVWTPKGSK